MIQWESGTRRYLTRKPPVRVKTASEWFFLVVRRKYRISFKKTMNQEAITNILNWARSLLELNEEEALQQLAELREVPPALYPLVELDRDIEEEEQLHENEPEPQQIDAHRDAKLFLRDQAGRARAYTTNPLENNQPQGQRRTAFAAKVFILTKEIKTSMNRQLKVNYEILLEKALIATKLKALKDLYGDNQKQKFKTLVKQQFQMDTRYV